MKTIQSATLLLILFVVIPISINAQKNNARISFKTLLEEMLSREAITKLPSSSYRNLQASSYDRRSVNKENGWYANSDRSQFIDVEMNDDGRYEHVMMQAKGPGAIVRFWAVTGQKSLLRGTLRIYIDQDSTPTFEGTLEDLIGGNYFTSQPLSQAVSEVSADYQRGRNLYLPIPFAKSIKITYQKEDGLNLYDAKKMWPDNSVFYNINYRIYNEGTNIESLTSSVLNASEKQIIETNKQLLLANTDKSQRVIALDSKLKPEETKTFTITKPHKKGGAINQISLKLEAGNLPQALRSTILEISFDGERTAWSPLGDFMGTGYQIRPSKTWYGKVEANGLMICKWLMPFANTCEIKIHNLGTQEVKIKRGEVSVKKYEWDNQSMHFGAAWKQHTNIPSKPNKDINYVTLQGKGMYVGDVLTLFDTHKDWWGEGDEKIFVDDDTFPSHFGTGTEDYYGYAWCLNARFSTPFIMQPDGSGNMGIGFTVNGRYRLLDGIPFKKQITLDMELQHWKEARLNYAPTIYWYARPGVKCNIKPDPETAKLPVALSVQDFE